MCSVNYLLGQSDSLLKSSSKISDRLCSKIDSKSAKLDLDIENESETYLQKFAKQEAALKTQLYKNDSNSAKYLFFSNPEQQYFSLIHKIKADTAKLIKPSNSEYLPYADSLQGILKFLNGNPSILSTTSKLNSSNLQASLGNIQTLQSKMQDAEVAKQFVEARKEQIKQYILAHTQLPTEVSKIYDQYNRQLYYYTQQLNEYKEIFNDPDKMTSAALKMLNRIPAFNSFMQKNSFLSGIFNMPGDYDLNNSIPGMQSRDMIKQMLQTQISGGGSNAASALTQSLASAQGQLQNLKDKISSLGGSSENADLPKGFQPNDQKSKSLFKRLEFGINVQNTQSSHFFPTMTDFGLSVGYKLNNKSTIGVGGSYNVGWGTNINHIKISSQGAGIRSFFDYKIKGSIYATGGFEYNYQKIDYSISQNHYANIWQKSGLIGLSKVVSMNSQYFKKTKIELLWNFLSYQQIPRTQPILFRVEYNF